MKIKQVLTSWSSTVPQAPDTSRTPGKWGAGGSPRPGPAPPVLALRRALHGDVTGAADHHRVRRVLEQLLLQGPLLVLLLLVDLVEIRHPEAPRPLPEGPDSRDRGRGPGCQAAEAEGAAAAGAEAAELAPGFWTRATETGSRPSPPLPSAVTTTQCQHPPRADTPPAPPPPQQLRQPQQQPEPPAAGAAGYGIARLPGSAGGAWARGRAYVRPPAPRPLPSPAHPPTAPRERAPRRGPAPGKWVADLRAGCAAPALRTGLRVSGGRVVHPSDL